MERITYEPHHHRRHLRRPGQAGRTDGHRLRLGPDHPGHEDLRLYRAQRRLLLQKSSGRHGRQHAGQLQGDRRPERGGRPHRHRHRGPDPQAKQPLEVKAQTIAVGGPPPPTTPFRRSATPWEYLRTIQHLRPRTNLFSAAFRVRSVAAHAIHCFFQDRGFVYVHTPIITASDCEGPGEMFQVTTLDLDNVPKNPDGTVDYPGLLRQAGQPHRLRPAQLPRTSPWPSATCTPSAPPSGRRTPTPSATPPSSG